MRFVLAFFFLWSLSTGIAQETEYPDYRSKRELFNRIIEKDIRSDVSTFTLSGIDESISKLPLRSIPATAYGNNFVTFFGDGIMVTITSAPFEAAKHKLGYYEKYLVKIDNKPYFGDYGKVPKTVVGSVQVIFNHDTVNVPAAACTDLANPLLSFNERGVQKTSNKVFISADNRKVYIYMLKPEDGGSYEVTWVIQDKKYLRRVVDFGILK